MQFYYYQQAGEQTLELDKESYHYLITVRRLRVGDTVVLRKHEDENAYRYQINSIGKKSALLQCTDTLIQRVVPARALHLGWCLIEAKQLEKMLPSLNEIGVTKLSFIRCQRSQNVKLDQERLDRILEASNMQSGRTDKMSIEMFDSLKSFVHRYPHSALIDFSAHSLSDHRAFEAYIIGCEGGFSEQERVLFPQEQRLGLATPMILRSETAVVAVASLLAL